MSGAIWTKFFWSDWDTDPALRACSFAAQGFWMRLLCIAAAHDPIGYVAVAGRSLTETDIARMTGGSESEVSALLGELDRNGVFSRDRHGRIYSRRMVLDARKAATAKKNGKLGGNPSLGKHGKIPKSVNHPDKSGLKTQEPEARSQEVIVPFPEPPEIDQPQQNGRAVPRGSRLPPDWDGEGEAVTHAIRAGFNDLEAFQMLDDFRDFWTAKAGADACKLDWLATWRRWVREEGKRRSRRQTGPPKRVGWV